MSVSTINNCSVFELSMLRMGQMLTNITAQQIGMGNKFLKVTIAENIGNTGHNLDFRA